MENGQTKENPPQYWKTSLASSHCAIQNELNICNVFPFVLTLFTLVMKLVEVSIKMHSSRSNVTRLSFQRLVYRFFFLLFCLFSKINLANGIESCIEHILHESYTTNKAAWVIWRCCFFILLFCLSIPSVGFESIYSPRLSSLLWAVRFSCVCTFCVCVCVLLAMVTLISIPKAKHLHTTHHSFLYWIGVCCVWIYRVDRKGKKSTEDNKCVRILDSSRL